MALVPHLGSATIETRTAMATLAADDVGAGNRYTDTALTKLVVSSERVP